jgi:hypothetical protein
MQPVEGLAVVLVHELPNHHERTSRPWKERALMTASV